MVPAIGSASYLTPITNKRKIIPKINPNSETVNIVEKVCINHSNCFKTKNSKTQQYKNSFFVKTINDWNALEEIAVCVRTVESFKTALTGRDWPNSTPPTHNASSGYSAVHIQIQNNILVNFKQIILVKSWTIFKLNQKTLIL